MQVNETEMRPLECGGKRGLASATPLFLGAAEPAAEQPTAGTAKAGPPPVGRCPRTPKRPADGSQIFHVRSVNDTEMRGCFRP